MCKLGRRLYTTGYLATWIRGNEETNSNFAVTSRIEKLPIGPAIRRVLTLRWAWILRVGPPASTMQELGPAQAGYAVHRNARGDRGLLTT